MDLDERVRVSVLRWFAERSRPPAPNELASDLDVDLLEVHDSLFRLADRHQLVLAPGTPYVWMANPFSAIPTPFAVESGGRRWWGNCIWDALGVLAAVGVDGTVTTGCPDCAEQIVLRTQGPEIVGDDAVVHFAVPALHWWDDIGYN